MSTVLNDIRAAFSSHLISLSLVGFEIAWEGVEYTPTEGQNYLRPHLLPAPPNQASLGTTGQNEHTGIYQISVFSPPGQGVGELFRKVDEILTHFKRGTRLTYNGLETTIKKASPGPYRLGDFTHSQILKDWLHIPVSIYYSSYSSN